MMPALPAAAASWHIVSTGDVKTEIDESSLSRTGKKTTLWLRASYADPQQARPGDFFFSSYKMQAQIDCTERTLKPLMKLYYAEDGGEIKAVRYTELDRPTPVVPETVEEKALQFACAAKTEPAKPEKVKKKRPSAKKKPKPTAAEAKPAKVAEKPAPAPVGKAAPGPAKKVSGKPAVKLQTKSTKPTERPLDKSFPVVDKTAKPEKIPPKTGQKPDGAKPAKPPAGAQQ